jgi:hypothetical protein
MKPISKKVVEAGLVDKHTVRLMQKWGYMSIGPDDDNPGKQVQRDCRESLTEFVDDLDNLLAQEEEVGIKETRLSITLTDPLKVTWVGTDSPFVIFRDEAGKFIFPASHIIENGMRFSSVLSGGRRGTSFMITDHVPLWHDDVLYAYQVDAFPT